MKILLTIVGVILVWAGATFASPPENSLRPAMRPATGGVIEMAALAPQTLGDIRPVMRRDPPAVEPPALEVGAAVTPSRGDSPISDAGFRDWIASARPP